MRRAALIAAAVAAVTLAAVLPAPDGPSAAPAGVRRGAGAPRAFEGIVAGVPLQRARCRNWRAAGPGERRDAVAALADTVGGASTSGGVGTTLPDREATALLDRICATPGTSGFALYLLYARAAAFRAPPAV